VSVVTVILVNALFALVLAGIIAAAIDLSKHASHALDRRRVRRACRRGWDWPAFERDVARYMRRSEERHPAPPR
jgi:hypothetical protein